MFAGHGRRYSFDIRGCLWRLGGAAPANVVIAGDAYANNGIGETIQGIPFMSFRQDGYNSTPIPTGDSLTPAGLGSYTVLTEGYATGGPPTFTNNDANSQAMLNMLGSFYYNPSGTPPMTLTIGKGITPGGTYRFDVFTYSPDGPYNYDLTISGGAGGTTAAPDIVAVGPSDAFVIEETVVAGTAGQLTATFTSGAYSERFSGFVVSQVVPEPSTLTLLGSGAFVLLALARRCRRD